jgi:hypothetical protein
MVRPATTRLIEEAHCYSGSYRGGFANHLPMALVALDAMQAADERIVAYKRGYETLLEPLGDAERARIDTVRESIARQGAATTLARCSRRLGDGVGSAAFHGAIRAAYALESGSDAELAHALAYWDLVHEVLPCVATPRGSESPLEVLAAISRDAVHAGKKPQGRGISARMDAVARSGACDAFVARLDPAALDLDLLGAALIRAYAATGDFTLLHGVTGCQAFRALAPHFEDPRAALTRLWVAVVAAYMSCGSPTLDGDLVGQDDLPWDDVHREAVKCDDEHDVKLAYSCWREWQRSGDDLYRRAASARVSIPVAA